MLIKFDESDLKLLRDLIKRWSRDLGFTKVGITDVNLDLHENHLQLLI